MKKIVKFLGFFVLIAFVFSCSKIDEVNYSTDNEHIKFVSMNGSIVHQYLYDITGKIVEENCLYYFKRYLYDENDRLVKVESAFDESILSSSTLVKRRTEFMTSQNSAVKSYSLYEYNNAGRLAKINNYANMTGKEFELSSTQTFEYEGSNITKVNLHDLTGQITQYRIYTYDNSGNITNEKYYSNLFGSTNELLSETSYKYDNYENPFKIFSKLGSPGMLSNVNNIIESSLIRHNEVPGFDKYSTSKTTYKYNSNGYPIKAIYGDSVEEYSY